MMKKKQAQPGDRSIEAASKKPARPASTTTIGHLAHQLYRALDPYDQTDDVSRRDWLAHQHGLALAKIGLILNEVTGLHLSFRPDAQAGSAVSGVTAHQPVDEISRLANDLYAALQRSVGDERAERRERLMRRHGRLLIDLQCHVGQLSILEREERETLVYLNRHVSPVIEAGFEQVGEQLNLDSR